MLRVLTFSIAAAVLTATLFAAGANARDLKRELKQRHKTIAQTQFIEKLQQAQSRLATEQPTFSTASGALPPVIIHRASAGGDGDVQAIYRTLRSEMDYSHSAAVRLMQDLGYETEAVRELP